MLLAAFDISVFLERLQPSSGLLQALWTTVYVSVIAQAMGTALGVLSALGGMSRLWPLRLLAALYVWAFRGTPVIVQIFFWAYGAQLLFGFTIFPRELDIGVGSIPGPVLAGIVALGINEGAYMSEIVRGGILAVDPGQMEAARTVGMRRGMAMRRIVLPQAGRIIVPGLGNQFNSMLKTSSLLTFIGVFELFADAQIFYSRTFKAPEAFLAVACWYLLLTTVWMLVQVQLERWLGASDRPEDERWYTRWLGIKGTPGAFA